MRKTSMFSYTFIFQLQLSCMVAFWRKKVINEGDNL